MEKCESLIELTLTKKDLLLPTYMIGSHVVENEMVDCLIYKSSRSTYVYVPLKELALYLQRFLTPAELPQVDTPNKTGLITCTIQNGDSFFSMPIVTYGRTAEDEEEPNNRRFVLADLTSENVELSVEDAIELLEQSKSL